MNEDLLTKEQVAPRIAMEPMAVIRLYRAHKIPGIRIGHRTIRFKLSEVQKALEKRTVKAVS